MEEKKHKFKMMYFDVLESIGASPKIVDGEVICDEVDLNDGIDNLEIQINNPGLIADEDEANHEIEKLNLQPFQLLAYLRRYAPGWEGLKRMEKLGS